MTVKHYETETGVAFDTTRIAPHPRMIALAADHTTADHFDVRASVVAETVDTIDQIVERER